MYTEMEWNSDVSMFRKLRFGNIQSYSENTFLNWTSLLNVRCDCSQTCTSSALKQSIVSCKYVFFGSKQASLLHKQR